jgi:hypothetical protein
MKTTFLAFAFLMEIALIAALGYWGFQQTDISGLQYVLGIGLPLIAIFLWSYYAAPNSARRLELVQRIIFETVLFEIATALLWQVGKPKMALIFIILVVIRQTVAAITKW